ncbi:HSPB1-associated protein 1 [Drosophila tropicalis]|uniref:HSPB1-associated protein 1 n=1 Tax=Drosophila tropicalis TaxID=46794 RepID=UPI0035ABAC8A
MEDSNDQLRTQMRDIILNTSKPLIIHDFPLKWECFNGSLHDWCECFDAETSSSPGPEFELMSMTDCSSPQWERKRKRVTNMSMQQFLKDYGGGVMENQSHWAAYQYKRAQDVPESCVKGIDFGDFGFPDPNNDFTFWLGSEQANTPCHYDTYGINIVVQVYGSKLWLLFPPETPLQSSRIPYEESSVYCLENFYAPPPDRNYSEFADQAHSCILQAGDVLIVPRHWWHYVESKQTSLSVNYWVPLKVDLDLALDEFMVKHIIESFVKGENNQMREYLLNPNQLSEVSALPSELFEQYEQAVGQNVDDKANQQIMHKDEYEHLINTNSKGRLSAAPESNDGIISSNLELLINSMCAPRSIASIKREFFRRLRQ